MSPLFGSGNTVERSINALKRVTSVEFALKYRNNNHQGL
ncbi:MAG: hypothetical protein ACI9R3_002332 [Verrucomicrobiales bacterium]|jgi:hypothetical protein